VRKLWIAIIILALCVFAWTRRSPIEHPPGVLVMKEPEQSELTTALSPITSSGWTLNPQAVFSLDARVLGGKWDSDDISYCLSD
jgi:hypothetical protein